MAHAPNQIPHRDTKTRDGHMQQNGSPGATQINAGRDGKVYTGNTFVQHSPWAYLLAFVAIVAIVALVVAYLGSRTGKDGSDSAQEPATATRPTALTVVTLPPTDAAAAGLASATPDRSPTTGPPTPAPPPLSSDTPAPPPPSLSPLPSTAAAPSSTPLPPTSTPKKPTPTATRRPATPTHTATPYPAPVPIEPPDGATVGSSVTLRWQWQGTLKADEWFDVRRWQPGAPHNSIGWTKERWLDTAAPGGGEYYWAVAIVRGQGGRLEAELSPESAPRRLIYSGGSGTVPPPIGTVPAP